MAERRSKIKRDGDSTEREGERQCHTFANCPVAFKTQFAGQSKACNLNKERDYHNYSLLSYNQEHFLSLVHVLLKL